MSENDYKGKSGIETSLGYITEELKEIKETLKDLDDKYVTVKQFEPTQRIVWGLVASALLFVAGLIYNSISQ